MKPIGKWLAAMVLVVGVAWYMGRDAGQADAPPVEDTVLENLPEAGAEADAPTQGSSAAREAFEQQAQGRMLRVSGRVQRLLADDRDGSPHQRFVIATDDRQTLLVAHNLDLAPRLDGLAVGDRVEVFGEYEWNPQGGVMHWTHDDPQGNHPTGYIEWKGRRYQ